MAVGEVFEVKVSGHYQGQLWNNVLHFRQKEYGVGTEEDFITRFKSVIYGEWLALMVDEATMDQIYVRQITPELKDPVIDSFVNAVGAVTDDGLPSFVSAIVTQRTGIANRRKRGRIYIPAVPLSFQTDGQLNSTGLAAYQTFADNLMVNYNDNTASAKFDVGVWSRAQAADTGQNDDAFTPMTSGAPNPVLGTQRRRRAGHGQ